MTAQLPAFRVAPSATNGDVLTTVAGESAWAAAGSGYTDEQARDAIGAALVPGTGISIAVNDAGDTITVAATGGGGTAVAFVNRAIGKPYTVSPTPNVSYPDGSNGGMFNGTDWSTNKLTDGAHVSGYVSGENIGWNSGTAAVIRVDLGSAQFISRAIAHGRHGTGGVYRPISFKVEHSDNDSTWTTDLNITGLAEGGQPGDQNWLGLLDFTGSSHRYWRVTLGRTTTGGGGNFLFVNEIELWG